MNKTRFENHGDDALDGQAKARWGRASVLAVVAGILISLFEPAHASDATSCDSAFESTARYRPLPDLPGADIRGEAGVLLYLQAHRAVVEADGCLFEAGDRPLELGFAGLDTITLLVELPDHPAGARIFVTQDSEWIETIEVDGDSFSYVVAPGDSPSFEIAGPAQAAPTKPVVITKPIEDPPEPT